MLIGKEFDASALRSPLPTMSPSLYSRKQSLYLVKYSLYLSKYSLGDMVGSRLLQVLYLDDYYFISVRRTLYI